jgi:hypothetical protein
VYFSPNGKTLATGSTDSGDNTILIWPVREPERKAAKPPEAEEFARLWDDLAGPKADVAYRAIGRFGEAEAESIAYLAKRYPAPPAPDPVKLRRWLAELTDDDFATRENAEKELTALGIAARPALTDYLARTEDPEGRSRADRALNQMSREDPKSADVLRAIRAAAFLEQVGTPTARTVLEQLVQGAAGLHAHNDSRAALKRLDLRATRR